MFRKMEYPEAEKLFNAIEANFANFGASDEIKKEYAIKKVEFYRNFVLNQAITPPANGLHPTQAYLAQDIRIWFSQNYQIPNQPVFSF